MENVLLKAEGILMLLKRMEKSETPLCSESMDKIMEALTNAEDVIDKLLVDDCINDYVSKLTIA